jgi:HD domain
MTVPVGADGALGLYSAAGDAFAGRRLGFGRRRAAVAARFARHRTGDEAAAAANWAAGALAEIGLVGVALPPDATPQARLLGLTDAPLHGAHVVAGLAGLPPHAADIVRWHREHHDGTGSPDRLRWDGIPADAVALGIVHAFLEAVEDPAEPRDPAEALFAVAAESGRRFKIEVVRAFREFVLGTPDWDAAPGADVPAVDQDAALAALAARIDGRDAATAGRSERLATAAGPLAAQLGLDAARAARLARLLALGRTTPDVRHDDFDPLSRFARDRRAAEANRAAELAGAVAGYAADAPHLAGSAAWHEDGQPDRYAALLALVAATDLLPAVDAPRRLAAAAGTQFDPEVVRAYLAGLGATR